MKTIIDSEQAERLKEVCDKYGVELPDVHRFAVESMDEDTMTITRPELGRYTLDFADLLEMLPGEISASHLLTNDLKENFILQITNKTSSSYVNPTFYGGHQFHVVYIHQPELIDALFELFIWVIENGYYGGSTTNSAL